MEHKAAALKVEALQHLFIALAGSDCMELWTLLVHFFGKGTGFDPFEFLDGAPAIKPPSDLGETDSDEEASDAASSTTIGSVSTTAFFTADTRYSLKYICGLGCLELVLKLEGGSWPDSSRWFWTVSFYFLYCEGAFIGFFLSILGDINGY